MYKRKRSVFVENVAIVNEVKRREKMKYEKPRSCAITKEDFDMMEDGYQSAINGISKQIIAEKLKNPIFKSGYLRGIRVLEVKQYEQDKEIVRQMVLNNVEFDMAPLRIKNNDSLRSMYFIEDIKNKNKTKIKSR